jgi:hypothetical protein
MSQQKEVLCEIARVISGNDPFRIEAWFTEDFRLVEPTKPNWAAGTRGRQQAARSFQDAHPSCAIRRARYGRGSRPCPRSLAAIRDLPGRPAFARVDGDLPLQGRAHRRGLGHPYSRRMARLVRETVSSLWIASGKTGELPVKNSERFAHKSAGASLWTGSGDPVEILVGTSVEHKGMNCAYPCGRLCEQTPY